MISLIIDFKIDFGCNIFNPINWNPVVDWTCDTFRA